MNKKALITGVSGQDGSYLAELLLAKSYDVYGLVRYSTTNPYINLDKASQYSNFTLIKGDMTDFERVRMLIDTIRPDEIYNLAAQSHVGWSFQCPDYTEAVNSLGAAHILNSLKHAKLFSTKVYQASTSEMFGASNEYPQSETTPFHPISPYAESKVAMHQFAKMYREEYNMFVSCGILFNHESPRRGDKFVTRKITKAVAQIYDGSNEPLKLGNLSAKRDWGYAPEYVEAMWRMLQRDEPDDFVIGTGQSHSVEDFVRIAFEIIGRNWKNHVEIDPTLYRPNDIDELRADPTKAHNVLNWFHQTGFGRLIEIMVEADRGLLW